MAQSPRWPSSFHAPPSRRPPSLSDVKSKAQRGNEYLLGVRLSKAKHRGWKLEGSQSGVDSRPQLWFPNRPPFCAQHKLKIKTNGMRHWNLLSNGPDKVATARVCQVANAGGGLAHLNQKLEMPAQERITLWLSCLLTSLVASGGWLLLDFWMTLGLNACILHNW